MGQFNYIWIKPSPRLCFTTLHITERFRPSSIYTKNTGLLYISLLELTHRQRYLYSVAQSICCINHNQKIYWVHIKLCKQHRISILLFNISLSFIRYSLEEGEKSDSFLSKIKFDQYIHTLCLYVMFTQQ